MSNYPRRNSKDRRKRKAILYAMHSGLCFWCDCSLSLEQATVDELIPRSRGGTQCWGNIVMSCRPCNNGRGNTFAPLWAFEKAKDMLTKMGITQIPLDPTGKSPANIIIK